MSKTHTPQDRVGLSEDGDSTRAARWTDPEDVTSSKPRLEGQVP